MDSLNNVDEKGLIRLAQQGERSAFAQLRNRYWSSIYRQVSGQVDSREDAEDVTANVFESASSGIKNYSADRAAFRSWLSGIAQREIANFLEKTENDLVEHPSHQRAQRQPQSRPPRERKRLVRASLERAMEEQENGNEGIADDSIIPVEEAALDSYISERLEVYIWRLPEEQSHAVTLVLKQGREYKEAAEIMGKPLGTFKSLVNRALAALRDKFENGADRSRVQRMLAGRTREEYPVRKWFIYFVFDGEKPDHEHMDDIVWLHKGQKPTEK